MKLAEKILTHLGESSIHTNVPEISKEGLDRLKKFNNGFYAKAEKLIDKAKYIQLSDVSNYGAVLNLGFGRNRDEEVQLSKKKIIWGDILFYLYGDHRMDKASERKAKSELMKHGMIIIRK